MNKYFILGIILIVLLTGGISYQYFADSKGVCSEKNIKDVKIEMRVLKNKWIFIPNPLEVKKCDRVTLQIFNEDDYDHGFAIDVMGINKRLPPMTTTEINFVASQEGVFPFYCSVPCGDGHFDQKGDLIVR